MTDEQKAAYIYSQAVILQGQIAGMQAENDYYKHTGHAPVFMKDQFDQKIDEANLWHNSVIGLFHDS